MKNLTGKGKPFHSALDKGAALLKRKVGTGAEFMQELKGLGGIKQAEFDERKLAELMGLPKMTHEQFMAELASRPVPAIGEKVLGQAPERQEVRKEANRMISENARKYASNNADTSGEMRELMADEIRRMRRNHMDDVMNVAETKLDSNNAPYHDKYTLPGGENYREMLIKAPKQPDYRGQIEAAHRELRSMPYSKRTPEQEERVGQLARLMRELEAKEKELPQEFSGVGAHFGGEPNILASMRVKDRVGPNGEKLLHLEELQSDWHQQGREKGYKVEDPIAKEYEQLGKKIFGSGNYTPAEEKRFYELQEQGYDNKPVTGVPDAPFKKNWEEMALKRLVHHAAEKGYHGIVVTPGMEQAKRYNLGNQLHSIQLVSPNKDSLNDSIFNGYPKEGDRVINRLINTPEELHELIGKEAAEKLMQQKHEKGKEGNKGTHIRKLEGVDLEVGGEGMKGFYDKKVPNILNAIGKKYGVKTQLHGHKLKISDDLNFPPNNYNLPQHVTGETRAVHHFPITEPMRKDILTNGLPLYKEGGIIRKAQGGNMQPSLAQMRMALTQNKFPSQAALSNIGAEEAPNMPVKAYVPLAGGQDGQLPVGGVDMSDITPGMQYMPEEQQAMQPPGQPGQPAPQGPSPLSAGPSAPGQQSNILQMTPQGQAMAAMRPQQGAVKPQMAIGGPVSSLPTMLKQGGTDGNSMDNGATTFSIDDTNLYANGGGVQKMSEGNQPKPTKEQRKEIAKKWSGQLHYEAAPPMSKKDIESHADRMVSQILGIDNPHGKTKQQLEREKSLIADIRYKKMKNIPDVDYSKLKNAFVVGISGDPTIGGVIPVSKMKKRFNLQMPTAGATLRAIDNKPLESSVPLYGGTRYGAYGGPNAWSSDLGASRGLFNVVQRLHEEDPSREIYGNTHRMSNDSINHAVHMLDSAISHMRPHAQPKEHIDYLNNLVRNVKTSTNDIGDAKPHFVGFEDPNELMLQASMDAKLRKKILGILSTNKHFPGGKQMIDDIYFAISHPELRNLEVGTAGHGVLKFDPTRNLEDEISQHPTYGHDIPSSLIGKSRYPIPLAIAAPRSMKRSTEKAKEMGLKLTQPFNDMSRSIIREPIDQQYINQLGEYEMAMKKRLGYKKGGKVASGKLSDNLDTMRLALTKKKAK